MFVTCSGIRLVEREEEVLRCHEKLNLQAAAITEGNMALETIEKEMRDVQLEIGEEKRQIELKKKELPLKSRLEGEITSLQIEVGENTTCKLPQTPNTLLRQKPEKLASRRQIR